MFFYNPNLNELYRIQTKNPKPPPKTGFYREQKPQNPTQKPSWVFGSYKPCLASYKTSLVSFFLTPERVIV